MDAGQPGGVTGPRIFARHDPVTGVVASETAAMTVADAVGAVERCAAAFDRWRATGPGERRRVLARAADAVEARRDRFAAAMLGETGATRGWAAFNVALAAGVLREAAAMTTRIGGEAIPTDKPGCLSLGVRRPRGVCLAIAPWNAPVILAARAIATPLACGNTVVLKASELCPATHALLGECLAEAGAPPGVLEIVTNAPADAAAIVAALIAHDAVRHVNFTGSSRVGRVIGRLAGENLKPALLELGGKAPLLVLDDADLDAAVNAAIFGAFANAGQICMSTERIIVDAAVAEAFVARLAARAAALPAGDPRGDVVIGALAMPDAAERMDGIIADAVTHGGRVVAGGTRHGAVVAATLIDHVTPAMRIYAEESFGPVKPIIRVRDEDEAVRVANDTEYGLSAAVFSRDIARALRIADRIDSGICHINGPTVQDEPQMPFGGTKASGFGRFGGEAAIAEFTELRWVTIEDGAQHYPF